MLDNPNAFKKPLADLAWGAWCDQAAEIIEEEGSLHPLGDDHAALFVEEGRTLLVTFETYGSIQENSEKAHPMGWEMVMALGWSHLCLVSNGETWFRDGRVYGYFDRLIDDGFFDEFDQVIFYGAGSCGYAAAAYSVASPGAKVLLLQPQATLDPRVTEWDTRYMHMRRTAFDDRYGYAPDMLDAAEKAYVIYDPEIEYDAMHAALFTRPNVEKFRVRYVGENIQSMLLEMNILLRILAQFSANKLNLRTMGKLYRARMSNIKYLNQVLERLKKSKRFALMINLCNTALSFHPDNKFYGRVLHRTKVALEQA